MYEINILLFTALELNFITVETNKQKVTDYGETERYSYRRKLFRKITTFSV